MKAFGDKLKYVHAEPSAVTPVPSDRQGSEKRDKSFTLTFTNKEVTPEEVQKVVSVWYEQNAPGTNKEFFEVAGSEPGARQGFFKTVKVQFKLPPDKEKEASTVVQQVASQFNLPVSDRLEVFDSQLAAETQGRAIGAIVLSWLAIVGYLWFRFGNWTFGVAAVLCLIHDLMFSIGIIALCHYIVAAFGNILLLEDFKLDLPAVAALLTLVGYSVSDTIVVFDRIREVRGKNPLLTPQMINDSVNQTLSRTLLTALTVWLVVMVLYIFGGEGVKLFSFVMVVGVIIGTYSSIFVASPLLLIFGEGQPKKATPPPGSAGSMAKRQLQPV
jgi:SecD/SecF fusion protein